MTTAGDKKLENLTEQNRIAWETRSKLLGASLKSVLCKGLPDVVNEHLHHWHKNLILNIIENKHKLRILDVGCGYGRLSIPIIEKFPNVDITGVDISENYVRLYKENTCHPAFVGGIENIPSDLGTFDYILCVAVLMYLDDENLGKAVFNLISHLKPGGRLILIEPNHSGILFQTGFRMVTLLMEWIQPETVNTGGRFFKKNEIENLINNRGGKIILEKRIPVSSLCFLPMAFLGVVLPDKIARRICKLITRFDDLTGGFKLPSISVAYVVTKI